MKKYHLYYQIFFSLLLIYFSIPCYSQTEPNLSKQDINTPAKDPYFVETQDTVSTYGPHSITRNLLQDKKGIYWFPSWQGIINYDGKLFTNLTLKEGLIKFHASNVFEDKKGNLWFSTVRGGVYRYDGKSFTLYTIKDGLPDNSVSCMLEDKSGNLWFGTDHGVAHYNEKTFTNFTTQNGLTNNDVNSIIQDKTGKLWFGGDGGISLYDGKSFIGFTDKDGLPFKKVTALHEDKIGNIWIGRMEGGGLCRYNWSDSQSTGTRSFTNFMTDFIGYISEDKKGNIWITVHEPNTHSSISQLKYQFSLYRYDGKLFTKIIEKYNPGDSQIFNIIEDTGGNIWFGTMKGPCRYDGKSFTYFTKDSK